MAAYGNSSPWGTTNIVDGSYLGHFKIRAVPEEGDDVLYEIESQYTHRPDLLAYDLYGSAKLWWVFAQRNMDSIKDPVYDIEAGTEIYIPKGPSLKRLLGI